MNFKLGMNKPYNVLYSIAKAFAISLMLVTYVLFTLTMAVAHSSGGWIVVEIDKYHEGSAEVLFFSALSPLVAYVSLREISLAILGAKRSRSTRNVTDRSSADKS